MNLHLTGSIVLYNNSPEILLNAVNSFLDTNLEVRLFIIDNSPANSLEKYFINSRIQYLHNPQNPGFGASHNIAFKLAIEFNSPYHVILNPDIYFNNKVLNDIYDYMNLNKDIGQLMPMICYPNGELQYLCKNNPTVFDLFIRGFIPNSFKKYLSKRMKLYQYMNHDYHKIIYDIPYLSGCFMFFRMEVINKIGFFDEKIFMYLEDADITRRVLNVSRTIYFPKVKVYHHYAGLTHKFLKFKLITIQSAITYFNKWGWINNII
jgi:GT2 family glycosyltransferase